FGPPNAPADGGTGAELPSGGRPAGPATARPADPGSTATRAALQPTPAADPGVPAADLLAAQPVLAPVGELIDRLPALLGTGTGLGDSCWVDSGEHSATGSPILVNDPHLGASLPGIWYQIGSPSACGLRVSGFRFSGLPGGVIGHNDRI